MVGLFFVCIDNGISLLASGDSPIGRPANDDTPRRGVGSYSNRKKPHSLQGCGLTIDAQKVLQSLFDSLALSLVAGLVEQSEHILLVGLDTGLVEGIHSQDVTTDTTRALEEVE